MGRLFFKILLMGCWIVLILLLGSASDSAQEKSPAADHPKDMKWIQGGSFTMGNHDGFPYEGPAHQVTVPSFWMDAHEITVAEFAEFVKAAGCKTDAEKFGWSEVFDAKAGEWLKADGADWKHPDGLKSTAKPDEPVTQVSWNDAVAYATWAKKRLPTEAEWEYAARGGLMGRKYSWGDDLQPNGKCVANWWQGVFPEKNLCEDGYIGRAPVGKFPPNGYDLHDMAGNVWEWCADWFGENYYRQSPSDNPKGPAEGMERVIRGGSWLCSENYCTGYRVAARSHATPDSGMNNLGFRCVREK